MENQNELDLGIIKRLYKKGFRLFSEWLQKLQELANAEPKCADRYVGYAECIIAFTKKNHHSLIFDKLPKGYFFYNGDVHVKSKIRGGCRLIIGGRLTVEDSIELSGEDYIKAKEIYTQTITVYGNYASIKAEEINAQEANVRDWARIWVDILTARVVNARHNSYIRVYVELNTQNLDVKDNAKIDGKVNIIQPSSNPQNTSTAS
ncbi:hypothetical protein J3U75_06530 [Snodgrassella sp. B3088]|uniref:hypothetical protein n=1 Tax=Snodgrassella sp. B3088 TaxID=2818038 RepID=UPI00226ABD1A|nr:hypothetical protein [Snodgrassella sp. B3088]MCX8749037.1 hypothetical protein [Snodgrassella sp. B3088]